MIFRNLRRIITIALVGFLMTSFCSCPPPRDNRYGWSHEFLHSELVFIGDILEGESMDLINVEICEVFKGDLNIGDVLQMRIDQSCGVLNTSPAEVILYGRYSDTDNSTFEYNSCGHSTSWYSPSHFVMSYPEQLPAGQSLVSFKKKRLEEARSNVELHYKFLRNLVK